MTKPKRITFALDFSSANAGIVERLKEKAASGEECLFKLQPCNSKRRRQPKPEAFAAVITGVKVGKDEFGDDALEVTLEPRRLQ